MANHDVVDLVQAIDNTYARKGASGVPAGGDAGEVLRKKSSTDGDTEWADPMYHFDTIADMNAALAQGLIPDGANITVEENSPTGPSGDSALSTTSENFVQNKVITLKINGMEAVLATVNTGTTADQAYAQGDFILMDGTNVLYKALSAIASGASFTTGSSGNVEQTTIGAVLKSLNTTASNVLLKDGSVAVDKLTIGTTAQYYNTASNSLSVGVANKVTMSRNLVVGNGCEITYGNNSVAIGANSKVTNGGSASFAGGIASEAQSDYCFAFGSHSIAGYEYQAVVGKYNNNKSTSLFEVGNGVLGNTSNAFEVHSDGHAVVAGRIEKGTTDAFPAASNLAPVEDTMAADAQNPHRNSYAPGAYVYVKETDKLYYNHLSSSIGKNDSFTGNVTETTVGAVLASTTADLGSKSSASAVTGDDAFSKIATLSSDLASKLNWMPFGNHNIGNYQPQSNFPSNWSEMLFVFKYSTILLEVHLPKNVVDAYSGTDPDAMYNGFYYTPTINAGVVVTYNKTKFSAYGFYYNGASVASSATCTAYYR